MRSPAWQYCSSIYLPKKHCTLFRDDDLGVQLQVIVNRRWTIMPAREKRFYFIDGVDRAYRSNEELVNALENHTVKKPAPSIPADRKIKVSCRK